MSIKYYIRSLVSCAEDFEPFLGVMCAPFQRKIEPAGIAYEKTYGRLVDVDDNQAADEANNFKSKAQKRRERAAEEQKKKTQQNNDADSKGASGNSNASRVAKLAKECRNLYEVLDLEEIGEMAAPDDIKKSYRKLALKYHPDKNTKDSGFTDAQLAERFREVQEAYEVLMDPFQKRQYDSMLPFDDRIPNDRIVIEKVIPVWPQIDIDVVLQNEGKGKGKQKKAKKIDLLLEQHNYSKFEQQWTEFEQIFAPVFKRNAKWSLNKPTLLLGGLGSNKDDISSFYKQWSNFRSWREFPSEDELNVSDAESREERRWMERENAKMKQNTRNEELKRISKLTELAQRYDPRLRWLREEEDINRVREQNDYNERKRLEDEKIHAARVAAAEEKRINEEKERIEREQNKVASKKSRGRVKSSFVQLIKELNSRDSLPKDEDGNSEKIRRIIYCYQTWDLEDEHISSRISEYLNSITLEELQQHEKGLDINLKAVKQIPISALQTPDSQNIIKSAQESAVNFTSNTEKHHFNIGEPIPDTSDEQKNISDAKKESNQYDQEQKQNQIQSTEWSVEEITSLIAAIKRFPPGLRNRWTKISEQTKRTEEECISKSHNLHQSGGKLSTEASIQQFIIERQRHINRIEASAGIDNTNVDQGSSQNVPNVNIKGATGFIPFQHIPFWSVEEQKRLEEGLRTYPNSLGKERWTKIAEMVKSKTKKECIERFKELANIVKAVEMMGAFVSKLVTSEVGPTLSSRLLEAISIDSLEFDDLGPEPSSIPLSLEYYLFYISPATYDGILIGYYNALFPGSVNISLIDESVYCKGDGRIGV
ncbi:MAG: putative dnaJ subfamily C member 2 [Streblomastix strix]|uniref:Putative dnaJ subfamily C member 2 n=1 Tax=Streblomastix strix TaxID=222440 RepID=A0A5J4X2T6_9EUKA|nr:MAG: putative dnaJ subfamily C member 2 [Streblomastix strix]